MVSIILLFILVSSFFIGLRRGLILQIIHLTGFVVSLLVAYMYYKELAVYIRLWIPYPQLPADSPISMLVDIFNFESVYYSGIAFAILFFGTKILMQIIGSMLDFVSHLPILRTVNGWLGGLLCFIEAYLILFVILHVAALLPVETVQSLLHQSTLAQLILDHTPFLSQWLKELWVTNPL
ncbi:CvpA family protein [Bacillus alkalicellulosilyticus]|uniref:CvpA family protein n=1 Tax=Alkalihalobacterium alkalicellulosilyticum TaxID=1912214 RepID=UPI0009964F43|nr:CvpA family protein [Bacillus alkalicellulosilyticus]